MYINSLWLVIITMFCIYEKGKSPVEKKIMKIVCFQKNTKQKCHKNVKDKKSKAAKTSLCPKLISSL